MEIHSPNPIHQITDYSETQRVVLLIDLNPIISLQNVSKARFIDSLLCSAKTLLSFPSLSSSLFAFRFFFSSLSPLFSSSKIQTFVPGSSISLSFDHPVPTLDSLARALSSLSSTSRVGDGSASSVPLASCLVASMRQLVHDYAWDPVIGDLASGTLLNFDSVVVRSNLVVLFSPIPSSFKSLAEFLNVGIEDECFGNVGAFCERFCGVFANVNEAFVSRDIQFSWVDVRSEMRDELEMEFEFVESGIRNSGWGFCSTDSIVLGSAIVPFGLIYPKIGISPNSFSCNDCSKKILVQLSLEIIDVAQKPLECKCSGLELVDMKFFPRNGSNNNVLCNPDVMNSRKVGIELKKKLLSCFGDGVHKFQVKALHKNSEFRKFRGNLSDPMLVREGSLKPEKDQKESCDDFFADKVLEMLTGYLPRKSAPIWQILLTFLYREGYCAMATISDPNGNSLIGILKPFTVSAALLFLTDDVLEFQADLAKFSTRFSNETSPTVDLSYKDGKKSKRKNNVKLLQNQTWNGFCAAAFEHSELELEDIYFSKQSSNSKKLRFLKCWMKQATKSSCVSVVLEEKPKPSQLEISKDVVDERLTEFCLENEQQISSASAGEYSLSAASRIQEPDVSRIEDADPVDFQLESSESFFSNLSKKIQQGLESEAVDLAALAQRLVITSICWLNRKYDIQASENQLPIPKSQDSTAGSRGAELVQLLLRDPKDFIAKGRGSDTPSQDPEGTAPERIVREYELQILFRMEILQSEIGETIGESTKQKFVKQICLLLETIQCHLEGGFFGDWSVDNYVGKIIKARYNHTLEDIVHKIYKKMDLLLFADEDELPNHAFNSEDSNRSWREKPDRDELDELRNSEPLSAEDSIQSLDIDNGSHGMAQEHAQKLTKAKERRERARRFTSFTSWVPDLQRVWAPKQPKPTKPKSDPHGKRPKRKKRAEEIDTVCETPMTENKRSQLRRNYESEDYRDKDYSNHSSRSVSKSLFQDDG